MYTKLKRQTTVHILSVKSKSYLKKVSQFLPNCLNVVPRFSPSFQKLCQNCLKMSKVVSKMSQSRTKVVPKMSQSCTKYVSKMSQSCLKVVSKLSQVAPKMSQSCLKVALKMYLSCFKAVPKLSQRCLKVVQKLWHFIWSFCLKNLIDEWGSDEITFGHLPSGDENGSED